LLKLCTHCEEEFNHCQLYCKHCWKTNILNNGSCVANLCVNLLVTADILFCPFPCTNMSCNNRCLFFRRLKINHTMNPMSLYLILAPSRTVIRFVIIRSVTESKQSFSNGLLTKYFVGSFFFFPQNILRNVTKITKVFVQRLSTFSRLNRIFHEHEKSQEFRLQIRQ
jgi:hypothetical protein